MNLGTPNAPGIIGLGTGIKYIFEKGIDNIRKKRRRPYNALYRGKQVKIDKIILYGTLEKNQNHAPVVALNIGEADSSEISYILDEEYDIAVRPRGYIVHL